ncbi:MAG: type II toxin-antitoxin system VapC family toxin [Alphaproteobacteria bacterium]
MNDEPDILLDTNVISELMREEPDPAVLRWIAPLPMSGLFLSVISLGELVHGVERLPRGARRSHLERKVERLTEEFGPRLLSFDRECAILWGRTLATSAAAGRPRPAIDGQIAAVAMRYGLRIASRDQRAFAGLDVVRLDPWGSPQTQGRG